jgi:hypothetical protein
MLLIKLVESNKLLGSVNIGGVQDKEERHHQEGRLICGTVLGCTV